MLATAWAYNWNEWLLYHKVIFDGENRLIYIDPSVDIIDVQIDLYSAWKEWMIVSQQASGATKWVAAMRSTGGDPTATGNLGRTFFLINGWRIFLDHGVRFVGNLLEEGGDSPFVLEEGVQIAISEVSNLVVETSGNVAAGALAQAVWDQAVSGIGSTGSVGELLLSLNDARILLNTTIAAAANPQNMSLDVSGIPALQNGFYDNHFLQVTDGSRFAVALIDDYQTDGTIVLSQPLPFTPSAGATAFILSQRHVGGGSAC